MARNLGLSADLSESLKNSSKAFLQLILIAVYFFSMFPLSVALSVFGIETQVLIYNSKFASMVSPPGARRRGNQRLDGMTR